MKNKKFFRFLPAAFFILFYFNCFSQLKQIGTGKILKKENGITMEFIYNPGEDTYYSLGFIFNKDDSRKIILNKYNSDLSILWSKTVFEKFPKITGSIHSFFRLGYKNTDIYLFYSSYKDNKTVEEILVFNKNGSIIGSKIFLFAHDNCDFVKKIFNAEDGKMYLIPLKFANPGLVSNTIIWKDYYYQHFVPFKLIQDNELIIYNYDMESKKLDNKKITIYHKNSVLNNLVESYGKLYMHIFESSNYYYCCIDYINGEVKEINAGEFDSSYGKMNKEVVYSPTDVCRLDYVQPTFFELKNKEAAEDNLGKIKYSRYTFDGKHFDKEIQFSDKFKEKVKSFADKNGVNKKQLLTGFETIAAYRFDNGNYVLLLERCFHQTRSGKGLTSGTPAPDSRNFQGIILAVTIDAEGNILKEEIIDRKHQFYGFSIPFNLMKNDQIIFNNGNELKIIYHGKKKNSRGDKSLYLSVISDTGDLKEAGAIKTDDAIVGSYRIDVSNCFEMKNNEIIIFNTKSVKTDIVYKIKL